MAMFCSIALRRSPNPGALTAATLSPPRSLFTTNVASASPSTSSAMTRSGLLLWATDSSSSSNGCKARKLLFVNKNVRILEFRAHLLGIGHEVGRDVTAVEPHPLDHFKLSRKRFGLLDGDHAFVSQANEEPRVAN
jgi:hypothetical protein